MRIRRIRALSTVTALAADVTAPYVPAAPTLVSGAGTSLAYRIAIVCVDDQTVAGQIKSGPSLLNVYQGGVYVGSVDHTTVGATVYYDGTGVASSTISVTVKAEDEAGNESAASSALSVVFGAVLVAPTDVAATLIDGSTTVTTVDNFNRANGDVGASYTDTIGNGKLQIAGNQITCGASTYRQNKYNTAPSQPNYSVSVVYKAGTTGAALQLIARSGLITGVSNNYRVQVDLSAGTADIIWTQGGTDHYLVTGFALALTVGDRLGIKCTDGASSTVTIEIQKNGVTLPSAFATDTHLYGITGVAELGIYYSGSGTAPAADDFTITETTVAGVKAHITFTPSNIGVDHYNLYKQTDGGSFSLLASSISSPYDDPVTGTHTFGYKVRAVASGGATADSNVASLYVSSSPSDTTAPPVPVPTLTQDNTLYTYTVTCPMVTDIGPAGTIVSGTKEYIVYEGGVSVATVTQPTSGSTASYTGSGSAGATKSITVASKDNATNASAQSSAQVVTWPGVTTAAGLLGAYLLGNQSAYVTPAWWYYASRNRVVIMSWRAGWDYSWGKSMLQIMGGIKALNPNTLCGLYYDHFAINDTNHLDDLKNTLAANHGFVLDNYPGGTPYRPGADFRVADIIPGSSYTVTYGGSSHTLIEYGGDYNADWMFKGGTLGLATSGASVANSLPDLVFSDDFYCGVPYGGDFSRGGTVADPNKGIRDGQVALGARLIVNKSGLKWTANLSQPMVPGSVITEYVGALSGGVMEDFLPLYLVSPYGSLVYAVAAYLKAMSCVNSDQLAIFEHKHVQSDGSDVIELNPDTSNKTRSAAWIGVRRGYAFCMVMGPAFYSAAQPGGDPAFALWFDQYSVDINTGYADAYASANHTGWLGPWVDSPQAFYFTAATGNGTTATLTFATRLQAPTVGKQIIVSGMTPAGYNGTWTITASSTTTVSFLCTATGAMTIKGFGILLWLNACIRRRATYGEVFFAPPGVGTVTITLGYTLKNIRKTNGNDTTLDGASITSLVLHDDGAGDGYIGRY